MKIIFTLLLIAFSYISIAQTSVGVKASYLLATNSYKSVPSPSFAYGIGIEGITTIKDNLNLVYGTEYNYFSYAYELKHPDKFGSVIAKTNETNTASYLAIPLGLRYCFNGDILNPFIGAGFTSLINIGSSTTSNGYVKKPNAFTFSTYLEAGAKVNTSKHTYLALKVDYNIQPTKMYNSYGGLKYNSVGTCLSLGYKF